MVNFDTYTSSLFTISMFILYISTIILTNIFVFTKIQTLSYKCCRPFRSANYNTQHIPQTTNMVATDPYPKRSIRDRSLNRQTSGYTCVRIPYIERLVLPMFLRSIRFFRLAMQFASSLASFNASAAVTARPAVVIELSAWQRILPLSDCPRKHSSPVYYLLSK